MYIYIKLLFLMKLLNVLSLIHKLVNREEETRVYYILQRQEKVVVI
jgi:hypothetical protein